MATKSTEGRQWERIHSTTPLDVVAGKRHKQRQSRLQDVVFQNACILADIEPTKRQARKWNVGRGIALRFKNQAKAL